MRWIILYTAVVPSGSFKARGKGVKEAGDDEHGLQREPTEDLLLVKTSFQS